MKTIQNPIKLIILWIIMLFVMMLHANYHVGGSIFYGVDVLVEGADGTIPMSAHVIRNLFYHLPIVCIILLLFNASKILRLVLLVLSVLFVIAHGMHFVEEVVPFDASQTVLLGLTLIVAVLVAVEHFYYWKNDLIEQ